MEKHAAWEVIDQSHRIVALTGAGISVVSGIPDYRSVRGIYQGLAQPEYLLSRTCLINEPQAFYDFVKTLYHPKAQPNVIHHTLSELTRHGGVITQNIDGLHQLAKTPSLVAFHGSLNQCYCQECGERFSQHTYLDSDRHLLCGGQLRPDIVLYEEGLSETRIEEAIGLVSTADLLLVIGTSFKVAPFNQLLNYKHRESSVIVINDQPIDLKSPHGWVKCQAENFFDRSGVE